LLQSLNIEKMVGLVEALQENLEDLHTEHIPINQQLEVTRWQTHNYLQLWAKKQVADSTEINQQLQKSLEELRQQNEQLIYARQITKAEQQRYQNLFEFAPDGYLVTDSLGIIQQANYEAASLLSVRQDHLIGKPLVVFIAEKYRSSFIPQLKILQDLQKWEVDFQPHKGTVFPASVRVKSLSDSEGKKTGFLWSISDINDHKKLQATLQKDSDILENLVKERTTELVIANEQLRQEIMERKLLQKSLQESETRLTLALKASNIGIWDWHIQTNQTLWSSTMGLMYGLPLNTLCPDIEDF
ncbi:PAS domain S-box protein, partial [Dolichospermum sp. ST_sed9]|nr:PAS domain S-box protein [Dolichospermum sp. ST_sed9]